MKTLGFLTNLNLHLASDGIIERLYAEISEADKNVDAFCIAGNIADYDSKFYFLRAIRSITTKPILFTMAENDMAYSSIEQSFKEAKVFCNSMHNMHHLANNSFMLNDLTIFGASVFPTLQLSYKYNKILELSRDRYLDDRTKYNRYCFESCISNLASILGLKNSRCVIMSYYSPFKSDTEQYSSELGVFLESAVELYRSEITVLCCLTEEIKRQSKVNVVINSGRKLKLVSI